MPKTRREIAAEECNRDPIFLLQRRVVHIIKEPDGYSFDGDGWAKDDPNDGSPDISDQIDDDYLIVHDCAFATWWTESVWLTREEAEEFGAAHAYRWPSGWMVYCVCAEGELTDLLRMSDSLILAKG